MGFRLFLPSDVVYSLPERCLAVPDPVPHGLTQHHTLLAPGRARGACGKRTGGNMHRRGEAHDVRYDKR